jgi:putative sigma-54 modulation protein
MNIQIHQHHIELSAHALEYLNEKIENLTKYEPNLVDESSQVRVDLSHNKVKSVDEAVSLHITFYIPHAVIRAEVSAKVAEEAMDKAVDKLKKQIERYKTKKHRRDQYGKWIPQSTLEGISDVGDGEFQTVDLSKIEKRKKLNGLSPMHEDEALEQIELLGHKFFVFLNADTNLYSVLYLRENGAYGLIELDTYSTNGS